MDYVQHKMTTENDGGFLTPLNFLLVGVVLYTAYAMLRAPAPTSLPASAPSFARPDPPARVFKTFTPHTLLPYNGTADKPIYFAVRGRVFDVSPGRGFYGPGGMYENFAGRDATRGLACQSFDEEMLTKDLDGPLDALEGLTPENMENLQGWEERFLSKYDVIGKLVSVADYKE
jgi:membrane-associated progesterone receptor component